MIRVLIVEDSHVIQQWLAHVLEKDPDIKVIGCAENGEEAIQMVAKEKPDVVTMDVQLPKFDGIETTRRIMEVNPVPIVVVSSLWSTAEPSITFRAIDAGALAFVQTPRAGTSAECEAEARNLVQTIKTMAEVRVVRRWRRTEAPAVRPAKRQAKFPINRDVQVVAIGISTGGPPVLRKLLHMLPDDFPAPILIVQHIVAGFLSGLVDWLNDAGCSAAIAEHGQKPLPGVAYLAPDGRHMGIDAYGVIVLSDAPPENGMRPAVSYLFRSVAESCGARAVGILLTGMGRDGAAELKMMREAGAVTFAQDRDSSVVHGMPGEAIQIGAAVHVLPPEKIAAMLAEMVRKKLP